MSESSGVFVLLCAYPGKAAAERDQKVVVGLHSSDMVGRFESTVITKDAHGDVQVPKQHSNARGWAARGAVVGAVLGVMFPPSILLTAGAGAVLGGFGAKDNGLVLKAIPGADLDALGQLIRPGEAALVVVGEESARGDRSRGTDTHQAEHQNRSRQLRRPRTRRAERPQRAQGLTPDRPRIGGGPEPVLFSRGLAPAPDATTASSPR